MSRWILPVVLAIWLAPGAVLAQEEGAAEPNAPLALAPEAAAELAVATAPAAYHGLAAWELVEFFGRQSYFPVPPARRAKLLEEKLKAGFDPAAAHELAAVRSQLGDFAAARAWLQKRVDAAAVADRSERLIELADFHRSRLEIAEEILALRKALEGTSIEKRGPIYDRILNVLELYRPPQFDARAVLQERAQAFPQDYQAAKALLEHLVKRAPRAEAAAAVGEAQKRFPGSRMELLQMKRGLLARSGDFEAIRRDYYEAMMPARGADFDEAIAGDYVEYLRERRELQPTMRRLEASALAGRLSGPETILFVWQMAFENRPEDGAKALEALEPKVRAELGRDLVGQLQEKLGRRTEAGQLYLAEYLEAKEPAAREGALYHLARVVKDFSAALAPLAPDEAGALARPGRFDGNPGFVAGLLSLAFNATGPGDKLRQLGWTARAWAGRGALLEIAARMAQEFPSSARAEEVFLWAMEQLASAGEHATVGRLVGERIIALKLSPERAYDLRLRQAQAFKAAGIREKEWWIYREILGRASESQTRHERALDLLTASLGEAGRHEDVLSLYWEELGRRPNDAALYQKFLTYLSTYRLFEAELKVYEKAIRVFGEASWYHRLARWYLQHRRRDAYEKLSERVVQALPLADVRAYLEEFGPFQLSGPRGSPDNRLALALHKDALARHPHDPFFVARLEAFYRTQAGMKKELEELLSLYYFHDPLFARRWLRDLARQGRLAAMFVKAARLGPGQPAYLRFAADAAEWECRFETALPCYRALLDLFPADRWLLERVAGLMRSFDRRDEAAKLLESGLRLWPDDTELLTLLGELRVEAGDAAAASAAWDRIAKARPGDPELYLQAATVFWDYFDYGRAATLLETARAVTGQPALHAVRLAAVHESAGEYEKAADEYIRQLWQVDLYDFEARRRLVYLARAKKLRPLIEARFAKLMGEHPDDARLVTACAEWLDILEDSEAKGKLYLDAIGKYRDLDLLETISGYFEGLGTAAGTEKALARLLEVSGGERDYRLRLAGFLEQRGEKERAREVLEAGVETARKGMAVGEGSVPVVTALTDLAALHERLGSADAMFAALGEAEALAAGPRQRELRRTIGRRAIEAGRLAQARTVLETLRAQEPLEPELVRDLAGIAMKSKDATALSTLYAATIDAARKAGLPAPETKALVARLREDLARQLAELGKHAEALDQRIEILNREPLDAAALRGAWDAAAAGGQTGRLLAFYARTAEKSFKDYRWNVVLARLHELERNLEAAAGQWTRAIANEPHRVELHESRALVLVKLGRWREAASAYRDLYRLDNRNSSWLEKVARMFARSGDVKQARAELEAFVALGNQDSAAHLAAARVYDAWGQGAECAREARAAIAREQEAWRSRDIWTVQFFDALGFIARWEGATAAFARAMELRAALFGQKGNHVEVARLKAARDSLNAYLEDRFGAVAAEFATDADLSTFSERALAAARADASLVPALTGLAFGARLANLELELRELAAALPAPQGVFPLHDLRMFHARQLSFEKELDVIQNRQLPAARAEFRANLLRRAARLQRLLGNREGELEALGQALSYAHQGNRYFQGTPVEAARMQALRDAGKQQELQELADQPSLFRINWFLQAGMTELALRAVAAMPKDPVWKDAKSVLIRLRAGQSGPGVDELFDRILGPRSIARALGRAPDAAAELVGQPWFGYALRRGEYAHGAGDRETAAAYLPAMTEQHPLDAAHQLGLGRWALELKMYDEARERFALALELSGSDVDGLDGLARSLHGLGRGDEALSAWRSIPGRKGAEPADASRALRSMLEAGLQSEARTLLETYVMEHHRKLGLAALGELLKAYREAWPAGDPAGPDALYARVVEADPGRVELVTFLLDEKLATGERAEKYLRAAIKTVSSGAFPNKEIVADWRLKLAANLRERNELIGAIEPIEQILKADDYHEGARLETLRILCRSRQETAAETWAWKILGDRERDEDLALRTAAILDEEGCKPLAARVREKHYATRFESDPGDDGAALGLARALMAQDRPADAERAIRDGATHDPDDEPFLRQAAELLEEAGRLEAALHWREQLRARTPSDRANELAMARLFLLQGKKAEALELARTVLFGPGTPNPVREKALAVHSTCVSSGAVAPAAEAAACREVTARGVASPYPVRAEASMLALAGDAAGAKARLDELASALAQPAAVERDLALSALAGGLNAEAEAHAARWWRSSQDPQALLALFRALVAQKKHESALTVRPAPGEPAFDPYDERSPETSPAPEASELESLAAELESVKGAVYSDAAAFAGDVAESLAATGRPGRAIVMLQAAMSKLRATDAVRQPLEAAESELRRQLRETAEKAKDRLVIGEGIEN